MSEDPLSAYGDTVRFVAGRQRVLGGRVWVSTRCAESAAARLLEAGGPAFVQRLIVELQRLLGGRS